MLLYRCMVGFAHLRSSPFPCPFFLTCGVGCANHYTSLNFFIKYQQDKSFVRHSIYPYLCLPDCNGRYMDKNSGVRLLLHSNDSTRVSRIARDMREWSVAMPLIEEMAAQMDSSIWSTCQTCTLYVYNNRT